MSTLYKVVFACTTVAALLLAPHAGAQFMTSGTPGAEDSLADDALEYARIVGVDLEEAIQRLELQDVIGDLDAALQEKEADTFAGLWIEHEPQYKVVVRFAGTGLSASAGDLIAASGLEELIEVRDAEFSLAELEAAQATSLHLARQMGVTVESGIDVKDNRVDVYTLDPVELSHSLSSTGIVLPAAARMIRIDSLSVPDANIYGGLALSSCTSGFSVVQNGTGIRGVSTAAHCGDSLSYNGSSLTFKGQDQTGSQDVQWHTSSTYTVVDDFDAGTGVRDVSGTKSRSSQSIGGFVCKNGKTTGYKCGYISDKSYAPSYVNSANSVFIRVHRDGVTLRGGGDSGGPWFIGNTAYGTHSGSPGGAPDDALYMAINYITSLGVTVLK